MVRPYEVAIIGVDDRGNNIGPRVLARPVQEAVAITVNTRWDLVSLPAIALSWAVEASG